MSGNGASGYLRSNEENQDISKGLYHDDFDEPQMKISPSED
jgi:hypothetical protein